MESQTTPAPLQRRSPAGNGGQDFSGIPVHAPRDADEAEEEEEEKKPPPRTAKRRRRVLGRGPFSGWLTNIFGGMHGRYMKNWSWTWGSPKTEREPATTDTYEKQAESSAVEEIPTTGDSQITAHGAAFYKGEPIAGTIELPNFERERTLSAPDPKPQLQSREKGTRVAATAAASGTLTFTFGDVNPPGRAPRARILVERQSPLGIWMPVHDTGWTSTNGESVTESLDGKLAPESHYRVRVFAEYWKLVGDKSYQWGDGRTQVDYSLHLEEDRTATYSVTKTTTGKTKVTKKARSFRLGL